MDFSERILGQYRSELADAVLPGDGHGRQELRLALSELLVNMLEHRVEMTLYNIGDRLSEFMPLWVLQSTGHWRVQNRNRWLSEMRPKIFEALGDYFIEGGHEARIEEQRALIGTLEGIGVTIEGRHVLDAVLPCSGDWRRRFVKYAEMGRPEGVRFRGVLTQNTVGEVKRTMQDAGFTPQQIASVLACTIWSNKGSS